MFTNMKRSVLPIAIALSTAALSAPVDASTVTQNYTGAISISANYPGGVGPSTAYANNFSFSFNPFDTALGTLDSVGIVLSFAADASVSDPATYTYSTLNTINITGNANVSLGGYYASAAGIYNGFQSTPPNQSFAAGPFTVSGSGGVWPTTLATIPNDLSAFLNTTASTISALGSASIYCFFYTSCAASGSYNVGLTYSYTPTVITPAPVPLPAAAPLLAGAIGGLALFRRRKSRAA